MAFKPANTYDGTNDWCRRGADLTGNADSKMWTCSLWFKTTTTTAQVICDTQGQKVYVYTQSNNVFFIARTSSTTQAFNGGSNVGGLCNGNWHHAIMSADTSSTSKRHIYIDGTSSASWTLWNADEVIDFTRADHSVGEANWGGQRFNGSLSELWYSPGTYIDLSVSSNLAKFYNSSGPCAPDLGAAGATPTGTSPILYVPNGNAATNAGTGGNYTLTGSLVSTDGPTACGTGPFKQNRNVIWIPQF